MKIELKNTEFKRLFEYLDGKKFDTAEMYSIIENLRVQYNKAFLKYQNEQQKFKLGEKVKFRFGAYKWESSGGTLSRSEKVENDEWLSGQIQKVSKLANGQYKYTIKYKDDGGFEEYSYTNPMTNKNIKSI